MSASLEQKQISVTNGSNLIYDSGRDLRLPIDGLLRSQRPLSGLVCLLPNSRHLLGFWSQKVGFTKLEPIDYTFYMQVLCLHRAHGGIQGQLLLVRLLGILGPSIHGGKFHFHLLSLGMY